MLARKEIDATQGPLFSQIVYYAIPLFLTTLLQTLFNAVDIAVLGNMADTTAVASVGATTNIYNLLVHSFVGIASGVSVMLARYVGTGEKEKAQEAASTAVLFALGLGGFVLVLGYVLAAPFLSLTDCPLDCRDGALLYLRVYLFSTPAVLLYNCLNSMLMANGDSRRPLYYMMISGATNVLLNILLCLLLKNKVLAVAVATLVSQYVSFILTFLRARIYYRMDPRSLVFRRAALVGILRFGVPGFVTSILYPLSNLQIQTALNGYGSAAIAGNSAASSMESLLGAFTGPFSTSASVFMNQNIGAEKPARVRKTMCITILMEGTLGIGVGLIMLLTGEFWLTLILGTGSELAVAYGIIKLQTVVIKYAAAACSGTLRALITVLGYPTLSASLSLLCILGIRAIWMTWIYPLLDTFFWLNMCQTVSSAVLMLLFVIIGAILYKRYRKGIYKKI